MREIKYIIPVLVFFFLTSGVSGQDRPDSSDPSASKQILLHFDKGSYYAGDTIFFKAYMYSGYSPDLSATNLLVAFYNGSGKKIAEKRFPVFGGCSYGNVELKDSTEHGLYYFQAITPEQLMRHDSIGYIRQIFVFNPRQVPAHLAVESKPEYMVRYFPQGGQLIEGISNQVRFVATDQYGNPAAVKGKLLDEQQTILTEFDAANGTGSFFLFPELKNYLTSVRLPGNDKEKIFGLPSVRPAGAVLRIDENGSNKKYIAEITDSLERDGWTLLGVMNDKPVFQLPLTFVHNDLSGIIPSSAFPSGVLFIALRDKQGRIVAENNCLIDNGEYKLNADLIIDSLDLKEGGINVLTIDLKDSVWASLSLSVSDPKLEEPMFSIRSNVIEDLLFKNDKLGPNGGFRKIDWNTIFFSDISPRPSGEDFISVSGKIYKDGTQKLVQEGLLNFMVTTKDSIKTFLFASIDTSGSFQMDNLIFSDTAKFSYVVTKPKGKSLSVRIKLDKPRFKMPERLPYFPDLPQWNFDKSFLKDTSRNNPLVARFDSLIRGDEKYKLLEEAFVIVSGRKKSPVQLVNAQYTSGLFSAMGMAKVMDFINDPPTGGGNIFDYLSGKMAGVRITRVNGFNYRITTNRSPSLTGGPTEALFYLDEILVTSADISLIPLSEIAMVKYFPPGSNQLAFGSLSPILAVYTKKDSDANRNSGFMNDFSIAGYNNYDLLSGDDNNPFHQGRTGSIYWKPDLFLAGESSKLTFRFVNPNLAGSFRILIQGITNDGKLIYLEKTIGPK